MIGIKDISCYIPSSTIDNKAQALAFGENEDFLKNKIGAFRLPQKDEKEETSDLAVQAVKNLAAQNPDFNLDKIDAVVLVTQNGDREGLPHTSAIIHKKLVLKTSVAVFDVSLGCSGYVYGLYVVKGFLEAAGLESALLLTADPYSKIIDRTDKNTSLLFGDAATATWLTHDGSWKLGKALFGSDGSGAEYLQSKGNKLHMNGRQIFDFTAKNIPNHIKSVLEKNNLSENDVDIYCLHQGSYAILDTIMRRFKENKDKFLRDITHTGNTVSSSIPLLLKKHVFTSQSKNVLISGFGVGLSWASAIIFKRQEE